MRNLLLLVALVPVLPAIGFDIFAAAALMSILKGGYDMYGQYRAGQQEQPQPPELTWREQMREGGGRYRPNRWWEQEDPYALLRQAGPSAGVSPFQAYLQKFL